MRAPNPPLFFRKGGDFRGICEKPIKPAGQSAERARLIGGRGLAFRPGYAAGQPGKPNCNVHCLYNLPKAVYNKIKYGHKALCPYFIWAGRNL